jgi:DNA replication protein DnaC
MGDEPNQFAQFAPSFPQLTPEQAAERDEQAKAWQERQAAERLAKRLARFEGQLPAAYRWSAFGAPALAQRCPFPAVITKAVESVMCRRVVIQGPAGTGKTSLGVAMLRAAFEAGQRATFVHAYKLGTVRIQQAAGKGEAEYVEDALRANVVLLDDLGTERQTQTNAVPDVIFERHADDHATWVTTGLSMEQIASKYGDGICRRIFEGAEIFDLGKARRSPPPTPERDRTGTDR